MEEDPTVQHVCLFRPNTSHVQQTFCTVRAPGIGKPKLEIMLKMDHVFSLATSVFPIPIHHPFSEECGSRKEPDAADDARVPRVEGEGGCQPPRPFGEDANSAVHRIIHAQCRFLTE